MTDLKTAIEVGRKLADGITSPLPWERQPMEYFREGGNGVNHNWNVIRGIEHYKGEGHDWPDPSYIAFPDVAYIVHACNNFPLLAAEIERLEKELHRVKHNVLCAADDVKDAIR